MQGAVEGGCLNAETSPALTNSAGSVVTVMHFQSGDKMPVRDLSAATSYPFSYPPALIRADLRASDMAQQAVET